MDRRDWIKEQQREAEEQYDTIWAPFYGEKWGLYANATHQQFVQKLLSLLPQPALSRRSLRRGPVYGMLLEKGHMVVGIDQSQGCSLRPRPRSRPSTRRRWGCRRWPIRRFFEGRSAWTRWSMFVPRTGAIVHNFQRALSPRVSLFHG